MAGPGFDPNGAVRFDLKGGAASDAGGGRVLLLPAAALESLDIEALFSIGAELGRACGARVASKLGGDAAVRSANLELVVTHIAGELAIAGFGSVHMERWGKAMVAVVGNPAIDNEAFCASVIANAIGAASGRDMAAALLGREGSTARYFIGGQGAAARVETLVAEGKKHAEILTMLHGGSA